MPTPDRCPCCERQLNELTDFPKVLVVSVSIIGPEDVPPAIPHWFNERLTADSGETNTHLKHVPQRVLDYFDEHPDEETFDYRDHIYKSPYPVLKRWEQGRENWPEEHRNDRLMVDWERSYNWSPMLISLLTASMSLHDYFSYLRALKGREVRTSEIFPRWERYHLPAVTARSMGYIIPETERTGLQLHFTPHEPYTRAGDETEALKASGREPTGLATPWRTDIGFWSEGPNFGSAGGPSIQQVLNVGHIDYEGRLNL